MRLRKLHKDANKMSRLYQAGKSGKEISDILGYKHSNSVRQVLKKMGVLRNMSEASSLACSLGKKDKALERLIHSAKNENRFNPQKSPGKGKSHPNWIEDRSKLKQKRNKSEERWFFKEVIVERGFICELTGQNGTLSVHHIKGVWSHPDLIFDKSNCIVILKHIHLKFHRIYGLTTTKEDWDEFVYKEEFRDEYITRVKRNIRPYEDKTGNTYGRLNVLYKEGKKWVCKCNCGNETRVSTSELNIGKTKSCGCLMREKARERLLKDKIWTKSPASKKGTTCNRKIQNNGPIQKRTAA